LTLGHTSARSRASMIGVNFGCRPLSGCLPSTEELYAFRKDHISPRLCYSRFSFHWRNLYTCVLEVNHRGMVFGSGGSQMGRQKTQSFIDENYDNSTQYLETFPKGTVYFLYADQRDSPLRVATRNHIFKDHVVTCINNVS